MDELKLRQERSNLVETTRRLAQEVVAPVASELDRQTDPEACFSWEIVEQASAVGIRTATLAEEYGGAGVDSLTAAMIIEELARADLGVSVIMARTLKIAQTLQRATTDEQRARFLPGFAEDPRFLLAIGISEPETASDYIIPYRAPTKRFATTAVRNGDGWRLNGFKHFISNGNRARLYLRLRPDRTGRGPRRGAARASSSSGRRPASRSARSTTRWASGS